MTKQGTQLCLLWTTADAEVARNMVFMYAANAGPNGWWPHVRLLVWGPSQRLLLDDLSLREKITDLIDGGVKVMACKACAEEYGLVDQLERLGITVGYAGEPLTQMLKDETWTVLTF